ncbi:hypothetical protein E4U48_004039 [Claviceps purpurea]|nr:hypothetical protein E4U10_007103 [Claviceps purpurea]KAG6242022.1 hypothetical protein E4U23_007036 [Claviceps purpurea]KAG6270013.1 hypothetical protein E4U48_004039 [Claviceps purpurea]
MDSIPADSPKLKDTARILDVKAGGAKLTKILGQLFTGHSLDESVIATNYLNGFEAWNPGMIILLKDSI